LGIHYIVGRSGSGKTMEIYGQIGEALGNGENRLILMVPEQFTLQAERDLIQKLNLPGILDVEVLSFSRLAHKVFNEVGGLTRTHINKQGRHMILRRLLDNLQDQLTVYRTVSRQNGFISQINDLLSDLKKHDITPQELKDKADELESSVLLAGKLKDTAIIYEAFNQYLRNKYIDSEDAINALVDRVDESSYLSGARIWLDGFDYFPPQTLRVIEKLAVMAKELTIAFTLDAKHKSQGSDLFRVHTLSLQKIRAIAKQHNLEERFTDLTNRIQQPDNNIKNTRNSNINGDVTSPEIQHLEQELYQYPYKPYTQEVSSIQAYAGSNPESEVERLAARIISLSRERGWRFKQMTVVSGDLSVYGSIIKRVFPEYGIPYFIDEKKPVIQNPIVDLVLTSLRVIDRGYRYEDVFKLLKTGFCGLTREEVELLENYCLEYGIKGRRWKQPFELGEPEYSLEELNTYREQFINPFIKLESQLKKSDDIHGMITALYAHLEEISLQKQLEDWVDELKEVGRLEQAEENAQIWNIVISTFDQMVEILVDQKVSLDECYRILESGFSSLETGIIPTTLDQVLVGSVQRSKSQHVRALFVLGLNDGVLPASSRDEGLLAADERDILNQKGMEIGGYSDLLAADEKFGIYTALSKPSDFLWVSYAMSDPEGKALRPSILVDRLKKLFPQLMVSSDLLLDETKQEELVSTPESTYKYMADHMRSCADGKEDSLLWWLVYDWYSKLPEWQTRRNHLIEALFHSNQEAPLGREKAETLYSLPIRASVSRLEQYVKCPYAHFVRYGLRPAERKEYTVAAPDLGELFHRSIEGFTQRIVNEQLDWRSLDDTQCEAILEQVMDQILPEHNHGILLSTNRYKYLSKRLKRITGRAVWLLTDHMRRSKFNPIGHEISFGLKGTYPPIEIELPDGEVMLLEGRIDRADICKVEDDVYINVIDYKSGAESFDLSDAWYGLRLQLLVYLEALLELEQRQNKGKARPGGIFYFRIDDPLIDTQERVAEAIQNEIRKKLKLNGLVLKDVNIVRCMDDNISGWSEVLPLGISNKNDSFYQQSSVLEEEEFLALLKHVRQMAGQIGIEMLKGNIRISPTKKGKETACQYCPFSGICQFDGRLDDNEYRIIKKLERSVVIEQLSKGKEEE
jgi:ATP-dependent helicase/nuclease subunit B